MSSPDEGPDWADEAHLDEVFSAWVPGPPDGASAAEREMAGDNPAVERPPEDAVPEQDIEAALAAALAEVESGPAGDPEPAEPTEHPPAATPSEPRSPSWLNMGSAEDRPAPEPLVAPVPVMTPDAVVEPAPEPDAHPLRRSEPQADAPDLDPAPVAAPEPAEAVRPWTRSDDDILPGRRGKGRRR